MPVEGISETRRRIILAIGIVGYLFAWAAAVTVFGLFGVFMSIGASVAAIIINPDPWIGLWYDITGKAETG